MSFNTITIVGRLTADPESRYFESGKNVANFDVATDGRTKDDPSNYHKCEAWGRLAEVIMDYCKKGTLVGIVGSIKTQNWVDRETGKNRSKQIVSIDKFKFVGPKSGGQRSGLDNGDPGGYDSSGYGGDPSDEEVPF